MAEKKNNTPKHSAFEGKTIGKLAPKGTSFKHNPDGTITPIFPKTAQKKSTKK